MKIKQIKKVDIPKVETKIKKRFNYTFTLWYRGDSEKTWKLLEESQNLFSHLKIYAHITHIHTKTQLKIKGFE